MSDSPHSRSDPHHSLRSFEIYADKLEADHSTFRPTSHPAFPPKSHILIFYGCAICALHWQVAARHIAQFVRLGASATHPLVSLILACVRLRHNATNRVLAGSLMGEAPIAYRTLAPKRARARVRPRRHTPATAPSIDAPCARSTLRTRGPPAVPREHRVTATRDLTLTPPQMIPRLPPLTAARRRVRVRGKMSSGHSLVSLF